MPHLPPRPTGASVTSAVTHCTSCYRHAGSASRAFRWRRGRSDMGVSAPEGPGLGGRQYTHTCARTLTYFHMCVHATEPTTVSLTHTRPYAHPHVPDTRQHIRTRVQSHVHTHTHSHTGVCTRAHTAPPLSHIHTHLPHTCHTYIHTCLTRVIHTHPQTHRNTHVHSQSHMHTLIHTHTHLPHACHTCTWAQSHTLTFSWVHTYSYTPSHTSLVHTRTYLYTLTHSPVLSAPLCVCTLSHMHVCTLTHGSPAPLHTPA